MPYVSRDLLQFPVCLPSDGLLDMVVQEVVSRFPQCIAFVNLAKDKRGTLFSAAAGGGAPLGDTYWTPSVSVLRPILGLDADHLIAKVLQVSCLSCRTNREKGISFNRWGVIPV